jgi:hypothetical protein
MNSDQVFCHDKYASYWIEIPIIHFKSRNDSIRKIGVDKEAKLLLSYRFDAKGNYKLSNI